MQGDPWDDRNNPWWVWGKRAPQLHEQLRGAALPLLVIVGLINVAIGFWLWSVLRTGHIGSQIAGGLGAVGLVLIDLVVIGLLLYTHVTG